MKTFMLVVTEGVTALLSHVLNIIHFMEQKPSLYLFIYLLAIRKNTIYKLMWWFYKLRYDAMYYHDVV